MPLAREAGLRSLWFGIEDLTAGLVKKGQSADKTKTVFKALLKLGIAPMPMMIHHDGQPLWSWKSLSGLLNQVSFLRRAGAISCQVTLLTPTPGSKSHGDYFRDGLSLRRVGGKPVEDYHYDGSHVVATEHDHPWQRQFNFLASYAAFYNPVNLVRPPSPAQVRQSLEGTPGDSSLRDVGHGQVDLSDPQLDSPTADRPDRRPDVFPDYRPPSSRWWCPKASIRPWPSGAKTSDSRCWGRRRCTMFRSELWRQRPHFRVSLTCMRTMRPLQEVLYLTAGKVSPLTMNGLGWRGVRERLSLVLFLIGR